MARLPLPTGRAALPKNLSVQSGGALAGYLADGGRPQLGGVQQGGNLAAYLAGGGVPQNLTIRRGGSLGQFLRRRKHPPYNPDQPRRPKGRPTGGEWMAYTAAQKAAFLRRTGRGPFVPTPEMEEESADLDLSPFEAQLQSGGLMVLSAVILGIVAAYRALMSEQQRQDRWRLPGVPAGREPRLNFGGPAPQTPSATRIR
jgi:hypothetical protein